MLFSLRGDCLIILSSSLRFYWHVSVSFLTFPVTFMGFCYFSLDLWEEIVVLLRQPSETSVSFFSFLTG